jgi:hypothetical protein
MEIGISNFLLNNGSLFLQRFSLSYFREAWCIEYFIKRRFTVKTISSSLVFAYNPSKGDLHVSKFYPELYLQPNSKYMSAVCFCFLIHHCAETFILDGSCHVSLDTIPAISDRFYKKLKDFNFHVNKKGLGNVVELISDISRFPIDTGVFERHIFCAGEMPFM